LLQNGFFSPPQGPFCLRIKYHFMHNKPFKMVRRLFYGVPDAVKSYDWFGSGNSAFQLIIVSRKFREIVSRMKWRGIEFEPIELTSK
jgi:hypothetical protein